MVKNYFKIAIAVLKRRKFFTFISLFGISFTLTILIVLTAFIDHLVSPSYPDYNRSRELFVDKIQFKSSKESWFNQSPASYHFFKDYVAKLKTPFKLAVYTATETTNAYQKNKKISIDLKYTNLEFWEVYQFDFIEGKAYNKQQITNADKVAVISLDARDKYFGEGSKALGKYLEANNTKYKVIGVVKSAPYLDAYSFSDVYLPYTISNKDLTSHDLTGSFSCTILADSPSDIPAIKEEFNQMVEKLPRPDKVMDIVNSFADSYAGGFIRSVAGGGVNSGAVKFYLFMGLFIFLFMLLPTINLVNINISRIMERSSEIGVRKAFGASTKTLTFQFIVENMILTFIGGILGLVFSMIVIYFINASQITPHLELHINLTVLFFGLCACIVFGLFSGVYPAWRMSKLNVVTAIKSNN